MNNIFPFNGNQHIQQDILSQLTWSETYNSLKDILKRTANQLPLLISFNNNNNNEGQITNNNYQMIFFFDRNLSNKILLTPLQPRHDQSDQFHVYPKYCTFLMTDLFKGLFEFVLNGHRCSRIYKNPEELIISTSNLSSSIVFMSRDSVLAFFQDTNSSNWSSKNYPQGAIFRAERIHHSSEWTFDGHQIPNDYLECCDEDSNVVFIKMDQSGRYSIIATSNEQQENQPEIYLHSTQIPNINQFIERVTSSNNNKTNNCIRLVRGPVPHNFFCQYFRFIRQHTQDLLVGITQEGLVIEWNLDSHVPCRYVTNLNDILYNIFEIIIDQTLESYIDQARTHYRENFQYNMQLMSNQDWTAFFQYWKWIDSAHEGYKHSNNTAYQNRHRFHLIASVQDLSDNSRILISTFKKCQNLPVLQENNSMHNKKIFSDKQHSFFSHMSKLLPSSAYSKRHSNRLKHQTPQTAILVLQNGTQPFDDSIYDSNITPRQSKRNNLITPSTPRTKRV